MGSFRKAIKPNGLSERLSSLEARCGDCACVPSRLLLTWSVPLLRKASFNRTNPPTPPPEHPGSFPAGTPLQRWCRSSVANTPPVQRGRLPTCLELLLLCWLSKLTLRPSRVSGKDACRRAVHASRSRKRSKGDPCDNAALCAHARACAPILIALALLPCRARSFFTRFATRRSVIIWTPLTTGVEREGGEEHSTLVDSSWTQTLLAEGEQGGCCVAVLFVFMRLTVAIAPRPPRGLGVLCSRSPPQPRIRRYEWGRGNAGTHKQRRATKS